MTIDEIRQAIDQGEPIVINPDGTPSASGTAAEGSGTLVKPQVWAAGA